MNNFDNLKRKLLKALINYCKEEMTEIERNNVEEYVKRCYGNDDFTVYNIDELTLSYIKTNFNYAITIAEQRILERGVIEL